MRLVLVDRLLRRPTPARLTQPPAKPERVFWWWEQICNLSCNHCDIGRRTKSFRIEPALSLAEKRDVLRRLQQWLEKPFSLSFIAGEPFLHRDLVDVLDTASALGAVTSVTSNGTLLATRERAERVVRSGLSFLAISLDALDPEYHDVTRGKAGTWALATKSIRHLLEARTRLGSLTPKLYVNSIVMRDNTESLLALSDWVKAEGLDGHTFQPVATTDFFMGLRPAGDRWHERSPLFPSLQVALPFVDELERRKLAGYPIQNSAQDFRKFRSYFADPVRFGKMESCESELNSVLVTHDGHVKMCPNTRESFGHVLEHGLDELWASQAAERARKHVYECASQCKILANTKDDFYF